MGLLIKPQVQPPLCGQAYIYERLAALRPQGARLVYRLPLRAKMAGDTTER
ncbi:MAG: hypothetical protein ACYC4L_18710 [Chloroflexota bacterium]